MPCDPRTHLTPAERDRLEQTIVRVCARDHGPTVYYVRRDQAEPPCPACGLRPGARRQEGVADA